MFDMANIPNAAELLFETVKRAVEVFDKYPARWGGLIKNGMIKDCSWVIPASQYVKMYDEAISRRVRSHFLSG